MIIKTINLEEALPVRHQVLWPDKPIEFCLVDGDEEGIHLGAEIDGKIVSVASLYIANGEARLRKFATLPAFQKQGIGTALIEYALNYLNESNVSIFWCDARESAIGFYQRFGMHTKGERFYKSGVPYFKMRLSLNDRI